MSTPRQKAHKLRKLLHKYGAKVNDVLILGPYVHIDTYKRYHDIIAEVMIPAGFKLIYHKGGRHLDGKSGYRMVFQVIR